MCNNQKMLMQQLKNSKKAIHTQININTNRSLFVIYL